VSSLTWRERFQQNLSNFVATGDDHDLITAITEGHLNEQEYLSWCSQSDQIPVLNEDFFNKSSFGKDFLSSVDGSWNSYLYPVAKWESLVYIAGVQKPKTQFKENFVFVLASAEALKSYWDKMHSSVNPRIEETLPEGLEQHQAPIVILKTNTETIAPVSANHIKTKYNSSIPNKTYSLHELCQAQPQIKDNLDEILKNLKSAYEQTMIIAYDANLSSAIPLVWDDQFTEPAKIEKIDLTSPSVFKICATTEKPYHGYIVSNRTNDLFTQQWNNSRNPEHATLIPIAFNQKYIGAAVAFGSKNNASLSTLRKFEKIITSILQKAIQQKSAAA
jgi:hypothetical protein